MIKFAKIGKNQFPGLFGTDYPKFPENRVIFQKFDSISFLDLLSPNFMLKIKKIHQAVSQNYRITCFGTKFGPSLRPCR